MKYLAAFTIAFVCVYLLIPPLRKLAIMIGFVDMPTERKIHKEPVPHLASIGIFAGFIAAYLLFSGGTGMRDIGFMAGAVLVLAIGIVDDWYKPTAKISRHCPKDSTGGGSCHRIFFRIRIHRFSNPFDPGSYVMLPVWLQFILTVTWIFGVITVINFSDGLDGLAGACLPYRR